MFGRFFIWLLLTFFLPADSEAQQAGKVARVGYLSAVSAEVDKNRFAHFHRGMQELGYIEGNNIRIEQRYAAGKFEKLPELAAELIRLKVDVLVIFGDAAILAAKKATSGFPGFVAARCYLRR